MQKFLTVMWDKISFLLLAMDVSMAWPPRVLSCLTRIMSFMRRIYLRSYYKIKEERGVCIYPEGPYEIWRAFFTQAEISKLLEDTASAATKLSPRVYPGINVCYDVLSSEHPSIKKIAVHLEKKTGREVFSHNDGLFSVNGINNKELGYHQDNLSFAIFEQKDFACFCWILLDTSDETIGNLDTVDHKSVYDEFGVDLSFHDGCTFKGRSPSNHALMSNNHQILSFGNLQNVKGNNVQLRVGDVLVCDRHCMHYSNTANIDQTFRRTAYSVRFAEKKASYSGFLEQQMGDEVLESSAMAQTILKSKVRQGDPLFHILRRH